MAMNDNVEGLNLPKCHLSDFFEAVEDRLYLLTKYSDDEYNQFGLTLDDIRKPMLVVGKPGIGKTCGIISSIRELNKSLPKERQLGFKKILLGQTVVGSLSGIPVARPDGSVVRIQIPDLPDEQRDGKYGVLFLDEITTADEMQIQPALGLCDDSRSLGEYTLPEHWIVVAAGNGPDCTNFVRLDDMTITRFTGYDVSYSFKDDFYTYAHATGINEDILAFLSFSPDTCVRVESSDMDNAGKMFPCPRTWERLSIELKLRQARGKSVSFDQIGNFAGRIVGLKAGREFGAFMQFRKNLAYDPEKILEGTEKDPEVGMAKETYHIILESLFKIVKEEMYSYGVHFNATDKEMEMIPLEMYARVGNMLTWILRFHELENKINAIITIRDKIRPIMLVMFDDDFCDNYCPELNKFFTENAALLQTNMDDLNNLRF